MNDAPCMLFWPRDWLSNFKCRSMSAEARGVYIDLISFCWLNGSVRLDIETVGRLAAIDVGNEDGRARTEALLRQLEPCFEKARDGEWIQPRVERERQKQRDDRVAKEGKARRAAEARWRNGADSA